MAAIVRATDDPAQVLDEAGEFLEHDPVGHNVILTLLHARRAHPEPGRYWIVDIDGRTTGVVFQSPLDWSATVTPMSTDAVGAAVEVIVAEGVRLPGVGGEAATAAAFAGQWTERARAGARPVQGQRIYEVEQVVCPTPTGGRLRPALDKDRAVCVAWFEAFGIEIDETMRDAGAAVDRRLPAGELFIWDDGTPVALAGLSDAVAGVVRIGPVYTPPDRRGHGYASALVAAVSSAVLADRHRCILYTDLDNPTSNAIYRALGYRSVAEVLKYEFAEPR
jgi:predicted GNAT family acetyltransferase